MWIRDVYREEVILSLQLKLRKYKKKIISFWWQCCKRNRKLWVAVEYRSIFLKKPCIFSTFLKRKQTHNVFSVYILSKTENTKAIFILSALELLAWSWNKCLETSKMHTLSWSMVIHYKIHQNKQLILCHLTSYSSFRRSLFNWKHFRSTQE